MKILSHARQILNRQKLTRRRGLVTRLRGLAIEASGPNAAIGELCRIDHLDTTGGVYPASSVLAQVVGVQSGGTILMPFGSLDGVSAGCQVTALGAESDYPVGAALVGRVLDAFGKPVDAGPPLAMEWTEKRPLRALPLNPMTRPPIESLLETGIRSIDALLTLGQGQRVGIFAGSGVGKSTLLGQIVKDVKADVCVVALIGERNREVRDFVEKNLGPAGLARAVVIAATADQPALTRIRATQAAFTVAEYFRDQGLQVLLTVDSLTRYAMARREIGLSAGEPPTARGYTPSVFAELPQLCERAGTAPSGGAITGLFSVLVEGDDFNEPIADSLRAVLDGHIVLSRKLANQGQYPAIDFLSSVSRLMSDLVSAEEGALSARVMRYLSLLERNHQLIEMGAYEKGRNPELDEALLRKEPLAQWLGQAQGGVPRQQAIEQLKSIIDGKPIVGAA